jgi:Tat protein translocase TatB subunit
MNFFGVGTGEVILILIVALIIWGPKRLPEIARTLGRAVNTLRKSTYDLTSQLTKELDIKETDRKDKDIPSPPGPDSDTKPKK